MYLGLVVVHVLHVNMTSDTLEIPGRGPSYITVSRNASIVCTYDIPNSTCTKWNILW